jgi:heat shock protein HtpX
MLNLYTERALNIRKTWLLFIGFLGFVIGLGWFLSYYYNSPDLLFIAVIFSSVMSVISYWFSDKVVLTMSRAKPVSLENAAELYRLVENLAITAGLPTPKIYLVPEKAPNAFAAGRDPKHSVVAVTEGLLEKLDRTELEAVLSHELSHIGNRDALVGAVAVILVGFVSIAADIVFRSVAFGGRRDDRDGRGGLAFLVALVLWVLAPISATLIRLAISRKREFLADASGALLTRYPEGLASALEKISSDRTPMRAASNSTAHLWIDTPFKEKQARSFWQVLFMTHPPVEERVKRLRGMGI